MKIINIGPVIYFVILFIFLVPAKAQKLKYTPEKNVHSHNDYMQNIPFYTAYSARCASIEADVFLRNGELLVAHEEKDIKSDRTLKALYLDPIRKMMVLNHGSGYPDGSGYQLMVDFKDDTKATLKVLVQQLLEYAECFDDINNPAAIRVVISGYVLSPDEFKNYPSFIYFDGFPNVNYTEEQSKKVPQISLSFEDITNWNGVGKMKTTDYKKVKAVVDSIQAIGKKVRFWGTPDTEDAWREFIKLGIDLLNTDQPAKISHFLLNR
jgi:alkaline phosphatase